MSLSRRYDPFCFSSIFDNALFDNHDPFLSDRYTNYHRRDALMPLFHGGGNSWNSIFPPLEQPHHPSLLRHPGYTIHENDEMYTLAIDVPGVKASDMTMEIIQDHGPILHLQGGRKVTHDTNVQEYKFDKRFSISDSVDMDHYT